MKARKTARGSGRKPARRVTKRAAVRRVATRRAGAGRGRVKSRAPAAKRTTTAGAARTVRRKQKLARSARVASKRKGTAGTGVVGVGVRRVSAKAKFSSPRMQKLEVMLESKGAEILEGIKRVRAASVDVDRTSFAEVGDLVSASVEKEKAFEYSEAGVNALREIKGALQKLREGTYGKCERCGKPIGVKRLEAMPSARLCVKCKIKEESSGKMVPPPADNLFED
jgi:DnaK suppressor protein